MSVAEELVNGGPSVLRVHDDEPVPVMFQSPQVKKVHVVMFPLHQVEEIAVLLSPPVVEASTLLEFVLSVNVCVL